MRDNIRLASYRPTGQGEAGYEAAKGVHHRPDRYLYHCHHGGADGEKGPLFG